MAIPKNLLVLSTPYYQGDPMHPVAVAEFGIDVDSDKLIRNLSLSIAELGYTHVLLNQGDLGDEWTFWFADSLDAAAALEKFSFEEEAVDEDSDFFI